MSGSRSKRLEETRGWWRESVADGELEASGQSVARGESVSGVLTVASLLDRHVRRVLGLGRLGDGGEGSAGGEGRADGVRVVVFALVLRVLRIS